MPRKNNFDKTKLGDEGDTESTLWPSGSRGRGGQGEMKARTRANIIGALSKDIRRGKARTANAFDPDQGFVADKMLSGMDKLGEPDEPDRGRDGYAKD